MAEGANQRPRGRPPSFKNKPKLAVIQTTRDGDGSMKATVLEIAARSDVIDTVVQFERRRQLGSVTIIIPSSSSSANSSSSGGSFSSGITLADQQGHVFGGVVLVVTTFMNPSFHRLPGADLVVHDGGDDHGNPKLDGAGHGGAGESKRCSNTSMSISGHGISSPVPLNSLAPSDVVTWGGSTSLPHHPY
ncbi:hypothetical protein TEA_025550 [Camellia sinensis var. sinensis]|uniref:AT-hook motif nuclear-localized protein n=1 Tax=Camellia sinensis var. sinensis TaxID=542762 RepID=A0A4V6RY25_CAMSN|nr:hypothetical protein TEA_025550 [Camellia sinensis var. sinensis]